MWFLALGACSGDEAVPPPVVDPDRPKVVCPGDPSCPDNDGALRAGAAVRSIVPSCFEHWIDGDADATWDPIGEEFLDCGCDALCAADPGYPGPDDGEGDGAFQAVWIAGFQNSRPANGVRDASLGLRGQGDGLWATALVLDQGGTRVAIVALDAFGVMIDDTHAIREAAATAGLDIDHLVVHSSHTHASPDVLGIYGPNLVTSGYDPAYAVELTVQIVDALTEAVAELTEVTMEIGSVDAGAYHPDGVGNLVVDTRDPAIVDPLVGTARFVDGGGQTVATVVHFSNHPEETADVWALLTANFVHALRRTVEEGVDWGDGLRPGVGGVAIYLNGTVGGMMTSLHAAVEDPNGVVNPDRTFEKADTLGQLLGGMALDAVGTAKGVAEPRLSARMSELFLPVENTGFQTMFMLGPLAHRTTHHFDASRPINDSNRPDLQTEVGLVAIGSLSILCLPGEPFPELAIGGYGGEHTPPNQSLVDPENVNPPDLTDAPAAPYLLEVVGAPTTWVLGLANDQIGYVMPPAAFELGSVPYLVEAEGDHYEETNSLGPKTAPLVVDAATTMIGWR